MADLADAVNLCLVCDVFALISTHELLLGARAVSANWATLLYARCFFCFDFVEYNGGDNERTKCKEIKSCSGYGTSVNCSNT